MSHAMKRRVTVLATTISVLLIAGVVFAAWTVNADGAGTATADGIVGGDINFDDPVSGLYPGHTIEADITIDNNETFPVVVTGIETVNATDDTSTDCDESVVTATLKGALSDATIAAGGSEPYVMNVNMPDSVTDVDCAGLDFDFDLEATLASVPDAP